MVSALDFLFHILASLNCCYNTHHNHPNPYSKNYICDNFDSDELNNKPYAESPCVSLLVISFQRQKLSRLSAFLSSYSNSKDSSEETEIK